MGTVLDSRFLAFTAIVTVCYQFVFFVITALLKFDKVTDFAGSTNFIILAALSLIVKGGWHFREVVLTLFVVIWGLRLGLFLLMRILKWGADHRFDEMRNNLGKLAVFWFFQAVWVWTVSLPVTIINATDRNPSLKTEDVIGWLPWAVGFTVEAMADQQKLSFKNNPANRGKWCNIGVWKLSRHPNYFGESPDSFASNCVYKAACVVQGSISFRISFLQSIFATARAINLGGTRNIRMRKWIGEVLEEGNAGESNLHWNMNAS